MNDNAYDDLERVFPGPVDADLPIYRFEDLTTGSRSGPLIPDDAKARAAKWWVS